MSQFFNYDPDRPPMEMEVESPIVLNGSQYTVKKYARLKMNHEVYRVWLDSTQELPYPQQIVVKLYISNRDQGPAVRRFNNERNAYSLAKEHAWSNVVQYYGEVNWESPLYMFECFGIALEYFHGDALSKSLVAKMCTSDRDQLCTEVYRLFSRMANTGLNIGDSNLDHVRIKYEDGSLIVKVLDFDQSYMSTVYNAHIINNGEISSILRKCWMHVEVAQSRAIALKTQSEIEGFGSDIPPQRDELSDAPKHDFLADDHIVESIP